MIETKRRDDVTEHPRRARQSHSEHNPEVFVGGLASCLIENDLRVFFSGLGEVDYVRMMYYRDGNPRGFAFVKFTNRESAVNLLSYAQIHIQGKEIECKLALGKNCSKIHIEHEILKKLYVGNLSPAIDEYDLKQYFEMFGSVCKVRIATTKATNSLRGFAFVTFDNVAGADLALIYKPDHILKGVSMLCRNALVKSITENQKYLTEKATHMKSERLLIDNNLVFRVREIIGHPNTRTHLLQMEKARPACIPLHSQTTSFSYSCSENNNFRRNSRTTIPNQMHTDNVRNSSPTCKPY